MKCYRDFRENIKDIDALCDSASVALLDRSVGGRVSANAMTRSGWVLLCGYLEGFVRDLLEETVERINDSGVDVNVIPGGLFCSLLNALPANFTKNGDACLVAFKNAIRSGAGVRLNSKQLAKTGGNPSVDTIEGLFNQLGLVSVIDKLTIQDFGLESTFSVDSQSEPLRAKIATVFDAADVANSEFLVSEVIKIVDEKWCPTKKRRDVGYVALIQELLKKRNRIAHGEGRDPITPEELMEQRGGVERLCTGLHTLAVDALAELAIPA